MKPDDEILAAAARIADGSHIDWASADSCTTDPTTRAVLDQLKAVAGVAAFHRAPHDFSEEERPAAGAQWGPLTLIGPIGEGRFGRVFRAWEPRLHRQVALKLLHVASPAVAASPTRAIEEARMLARVRHPNVLTVHGAECVADQIGIWTEFIEGQTLEALLASRGPLPAEDVVGIGIDLCRALAAVHEAGLLHRDVKAQNVMRETGGRIVLMDFGTGHDVERAPSRGGDLSGTPLYLAPEVFAGGSPSGASDLYALAVLLFHLLTGEYPVEGRTLEDVRSGHHALRPIRLRDVRSDLPEALAGAIERGLDTVPTARYSDARAFGAALERLRSTTIDVPAGLVLWTPRRMAAALALALSAAAIVAIVWISNSGGWATRPQQAVAAQDPAEFPTRSVVPPYKLGSELIFGRPSHDGRFFPLIDRGDDVVIWEVKTGKTNRVTDVRQSGGAAIAPLMSPKGDRVAYVLRVGDRAYEMLMRHTDGTWLQTIIPRQSAYQPIPVDWSSDGEQILCWLSQRNGTFDLALVPVGGGGVKVIYTDSAQRLVRLSPDRRFVVMQRPGDPATPARSDLVTIGTNGATPRLLLEGHANERHPAWTSDGRHVFFLKDSPSIHQSSDGWIIPVADGVALGGAVLVAEGLGVVSTEPVAWILPVGLTDSGSFYRIRGTAYNEVYTADIDLTSDELVIGLPTRISPKKLGGHQAPSWSPDGRSIAYFGVPENFPSGTQTGRTLTIRDVASGTDRPLRPALPLIWGFSPRWSADGTSVTVWASDRESSEKSGYFRVDVRTGQASRVIVDGQKDAAQYFQYSADGGGFVYLDRSRGIVVRSLISGEERVIVVSDSQSSLSVFALAPDGKGVAFGRLRNGVNTFEVQPIGGVPRTLDTLNKQILRTVEWTPDSENLFYSKGTVGPRPLWRVSVRGGEPRETPFLISSPANSVSFSPDGRRMVYPERVQLDELWITPSVVGPRQAGSGRLKR